MHYVWGNQFRKKKTFDTKFTTRQYARTNRRYKRIYTHNTPTKHTYENPCKRAHKNARMHFYTYMYTQSPTRLHSVSLMENYYLSIFEIA